MAAQNIQRKHKALRMPYVHIAYNGNTEDLQRTSIIHEYTVTVTRFYPCSFSQILKLSRERQEKHCSFLCQNKSNIKWK